MSHPSDRWPGTAAGCEANTRQATHILLTALLFAPPADDHGTPDRLPTKAYIREGLRLEALYIRREQGVRTEANTPLWTKVLELDRFDLAKK
jgi:hypothetical protein